MRHRFAGTHALGRTGKRQSTPRLRIVQRKLAEAPFAIFALMLWASAAAAAPAGTVVGVSGSCTDLGRALSRGAVVQIGDTLDVPAGGNLKVQMTDGSVISIASGSRITLTGSGRAAKLLVTQGLLHVTSATRPFEVSTAVGTATVASDSADWIVKAEAGAAQVGVLAGTVNLTSSVTGESVSIPARWGTRLEAGRAPVPPRVWSPMEFNAVIRLTE
jgi:ferric-dicitrate binding protein FerR (iron transport regulator)